MVTKSDQTPCRPRDRRRVASQSPIAGDRNMVDVRLGPACHPAAHRASHHRSYAGTAAAGTRSGDEVVVLSIGKHHPDCRRPERPGGRSVSADGGSGAVDDIDISRTHNQPRITNSTHPCWMADNARC